MSRITTINKTVTGCFSEDIEMLTEAIKAGDKITGYFILTALKNQDGHPYYVSNANYDEAPGELIGNLEIEKTQLSLRIYDDLQKSTSPAQIDTIPTPTNSKKH
jgi:hypothetical protein